LVEEGKYVQEEDNDDVGENGKKDAVEIEVIHLRFRLVFNSFTTVVLKDRRIMSSKIVIFEKLLKKVFFLVIMF